MEQQTTDAVRHLTNLLLASSLDVAGALGILVTGWIVAGWAQRWTRRALDRARAMDVTLKPFLAAIVRYAILVFVVIAVLAQFGVQTASIIAALGTVGLAIGLALQGTLSHIAAGIMLLLLRPFRVGDYVDAEGIAGTVVEIDLFATELRTFDGIYLHVPNGTLLNRAIRNFSRNPTRRIDIRASCSGGGDTEAPLAAARSMLAADARVCRDPAPEVVLLAVSDGSIDFSLRFWVRIQDHAAVLADFAQALRRQLDIKSVTMPPP